MTREALTEKMKDLPNPPCRVNLIQQVWEIMNSETEELNKENGKLEGKLADLQSEYVELENFHHNEVNELKVRLTKAKEIIRALLKHTYGQNLNTQNDFDLYLGRIKDAEQFLKDSEVDE